MTECSIEGCGRHAERVAAQLCGKHYEAKRRAVRIARRDSMIAAGIYRPAPGKSQKKCWGCERDLPMSAFGSDISRPDGKATQCKPCAKERRMEQYARRAEKKQAQRGLPDYGVPIEYTRWATARAR